MKEIFTNTCMIAEFCFGIAYRKIRPCLDFLFFSKFVVVKKVRVRKAWIDELQSVQGIRLNRKALNEIKMQRPLGQMTEHCNYM